MSPTPPEAETEYSRGSRPSRGPSGRAGRRRSGGEESRGTPLGTRPARAAILVGGMLGALLLLLAEFTTLFDVTTQAGGAPIRSVASGSHHGYALIPIALLAAVLAFAAWRASSRPALLAIGALGLIALLIGVLGDLPDARATGLVLRGSQYVSASSSPSAGLYMETLGAVLLVAICVCGVLPIGPAPRPRSPRETRVSSPTT